MPVLVLRYVPKEEVKVVSCEVDMPTGLVVKRFNSEVKGLRVVATLGNSIEDWRSMVVGFMDVVLGSGRVISEERGIVFIVLNWDVLVLFEKVVSCVVSAWDVEMLELVAFVIKSDAFICMFSNVFSNCVQEGCLIQLFVYVWPWRCWQNVIHSNQSMHTADCEVHFITIKYV